MNLMDYNNDRTELLLSGCAMKEVDSYTIENGCGSLALMEEAAQAVYDDRLASNEVGRESLILAGIGNNGADGLALARLIKTYEPDTKVTVGIIKPDREICEVKATKEWKVMLGRLQTSVNILYYRELMQTLADENRENTGECEFLSGEDQTFNAVIYDCILGIGVKTPVREDVAAVIEAVNGIKKRPLVVAVDMPTGINADDGSLLGVAITADKTITFGYRKIGQILYPGAAYSGCVKLSNLSFLKEGLMHITSPCGYRCTGEVMLPRRGDYSNKGSYGKLLIIAGSKNMAGAAYFSAASAYAAGSGLVRIFTPECNRVILQTLVPEAIMTTYEENGEQGVIENALKDALAWATHCVIGPGLSTAEYAGNLLKTLLFLRKEQKADMPVLLDADALNLLAKEPKLMDLLCELDIVTPHIGEAARMLGVSAGKIAGNLMECAMELSNQCNHAVCVLKDTRTIVAASALPDAPIYINTSGNHGMATAGMGDVLTGVIGAFMAGDYMENNKEPRTSAAGIRQAAVSGVYLHGLIGDAGTEEYSAYSLTASKMIRVFKEICETRLFTNSDVH